MNTIDANKLIDTLTEAKAAYEKKYKEALSTEGPLSSLPSLYNGLAGGVELAMDLVKLQAGLGSQLEEDIEKYIEDDVHLNFEEEAV